MSDAFAIEILGRHRESHYRDNFAGVVELGRQRTQNETLFCPHQSQGLTRLVIASLNEDTVSRDHARIEPLPEYRVRITNLSTKAPIKVIGADTLQPGAFAEVVLPITIVLGKKQVNLGRPHYPALTDPQDLKVHESPWLREPYCLIREQTPARIFVGRTGSAYRTETQLSLRQDHAAAIDAVHAEVNLQHGFPAELVEQFGLFKVTSCATAKAEYLLRPDLGRRLSETAREEIVRRCPRGVDMQVVIGDGLSAAAVVKQVPTLLPLLEAEAERRGWSFGQPFLVRYCRVGVLNDIGELLDPAVVVLLIGERPGLATAESLSAYMAYRPRADHTDAQRNLISNIHARGVLPESAAARIASLAEQMRTMQTSGVAIKEELPQVGITAMPTRLPSTQAE